MSDIDKLKQELEYWQRRAADAESGDCDSRIFKDMYPKLEKLTKQVKDYESVLEMYAMTSETFPEYADLAKNILHKHRG